MSRYTVGHFGELGPPPDAKFEAEKGSPLGTSVVSKPASRCECSSKMASHEDLKNAPFSIREGRIPTPASQATFLLTGCLAGASTIPIERVWPRPNPLSAPPVFGAAARSLIYRGGIRFWVFDITRYQVEPLQVPVAAKGGVSGAVGGFAEVLAQAAVQRSRPSVRSLANQTAKLFFCFGTYTYLSTTLSPGQQPPKPFWKCWLMGAVAGGFGSGIVAGAEGIKGNALWRSVIPKGAVTIGTVIAVQVTSCAAMIPLNPFIPGGKY